MTEVTFNEYNGNGTVGAILHSYDSIASIDQIIEGARVTVSQRLELRGQSVAVEFVDSASRELVGFIIIEKKG